jgi:hypothetical protein
LKLLNKEDVVMVVSSSATVQLPIFQIVESDDLILAQQVDLVWYELLRAFDYRPFLPVAVQYYEALWRFNTDQVELRKKAQEAAANTEGQYKATLRLVEGRATLNEKTPPLFDLQAEMFPPEHVDAKEIRPGCPPLRLAGVPPKCFFAMFQAFLGVVLQSKQPEPEIVFGELRNNPSFARTCGFTLPDSTLGYRQSDWPSLRKLQQFDQIMSAQGLWAMAAVDQVARNFRSGKIKPEPNIVHDTTHYKAYSGMHTVNLAVVGEDETKKKSVAATTKNCRCKNRHLCPHEWVSADDGAGTVTKSSSKQYWAHKASTIGLPEQQILLDAVAMSDAASHDSQGLVPHLARLFARYPELRPTVKRVLDDGAADDAALKTEIAESFGIELLAPINPRGRQPLTQDLGRGIDHITPSGTPICKEGHPFELLGCRHDAEQFIFRAPKDDAGMFVCQTCPVKDGCYRGETGGRQITVAFERLPWIDPQFPQSSKRFQKVMAKRTAIERLHKLMKYDYGDDRLTKRGNVSFQALLDKTLLAMHVVVSSS